MFILTVVILIVVLAALFFIETGLLAGSIIFAAAWLILGWLSPVLWNPVLLIIAAAVLLLLNIKPVRRAIISKPVYGMLAGVMPSISDTEQEALDAGTTWWEQDVFTGKPNWNKFAGIDLPVLSEEEQSFIDNEVEELCGMLDEWQIHHELKDLPQPVWKFLKEKGFFSLIIPKEYGGKAFKPYAQSRVMSKIATRSITTAVTAMVPNSLGPGELLDRYGTDEQKQYWLPKLAAGEEIPCFGLTGPEAGSDAGAVPDTGIVCHGEYNGEKVLGMRLTFSKRWITLAPVATVIGLAFKLHDPDGLLGDAEKTDYGITCALIPADTPGVEIGRRHNPGAPFMNGPINGQDVFVPLDAIIGGPEMAGKGWRMLMEALGAGRGVSLPSLATASGEIGYRTVGAFSRIRRQFGVPVGEFEGVKELSAQIAGQAYILESYRHLVTKGLETGTLSVLTAMAKYHSTEIMRELVTHGMDIGSGRAIQLGPRNFMALPYQSLPIAITVEGANVLTRSLMIFGQGAMRCHPYLVDELKAIQDDDKTRGLTKFDNLFFRHAGYSISRITRSFVLGLSAGALGGTPADADEFSRPWYRLINRYSATLAGTADLALALLGGQLKIKELLSGRLGDVHSNLVIACAVLKYHQSLGRDEANDAHAEYALRRLFDNIHRALEAFYDNFPVRSLAVTMKWLAFPWGRPTKAPQDGLINKLGDYIMEPNTVRDALSQYIYINDNPTDAIGRVEATYNKLLEVEPAYVAFLKAVDHGEVEGDTFLDKLRDAASKNIIHEKDVDAIKEYDDMRYDCLLTDAFDKDLKEVHMHERII